MDDGFGTQSGWGSESKDNPTPKERLSDTQWREHMLAVEDHIAPQDWDALWTDRQAILAESERYRAALDAIKGPSYGIGPAPWLEIYREAGGGYEGLQAIARAALTDPPESGTG